MKSRVSLFFYLFIGLILYLSYLSLSNGTNIREIIAFVLINYSILSYYLNFIYVDNEKIVVRNYFRFWNIERVYYFKNIKRIIYEQHTKEQTLTFRSHKGVRNEYSISMMTKIEEIVKFFEESGLNVMRMEFGKIITPRGEKKLPLSIRKRNYCIIITTLSIFFTYVLIDILCE